jgi:hypothetical protein
MDEYGYPDENELKAIREWSYTDLGLCGPILNASFAYQSEKSICRLEAGAGMRALLKHE